MRDLKFRAYDNIRGKWLLGFDHGRRGFSIDGEIMAFGEWSNIVCEMVRGDFGERGEGLIVQQFTGLKSLNNQDIYEGDILRRGAILYTVEYSIEEAAYLMKLVSEPKHWIYLSDFDEVEVVGNIFELPS